MSKAIQGTVVQLMQSGACQVVTTNAIAIAFTPLAGHVTRLNDPLRFSGLTPVLIENLTRGWSICMRVRENDIHDLRLPTEHCGSRTPSRTPSAVALSLQTSTLRARKKSRRDHQFGPEGSHGVAALTPATERRSSSGLLVR
jgi:hypothetical protein